MMRPSFAIRLVKNMKWFATLQENRLEGISTPRSGTEAVHSTALAKCVIQEHINLI